MLTKSPPTSGRAALRAFLDLVVLAEPTLLRLWRSSGMTLAGRRVLRALRDRSLSPGELALMVGVAPPSMARTLARMEERGLIARSIDARDRRRVEVRILEAGRRELNTGHLWRGSAFDRALESLSEVESRQLAQSLEAFAQAVRAQGPEREASSPVEPGSHSNRRQRPAAAEGSDSRPVSAGGDEG